MVQRNTGCAVGVLRQVNILCQRPKKRMQFGIDADLLAPNAFIAQIDIAEAVAQRLGVSRMARNCLY